MKKVYNFIRLYFAAFAKSFYYFLFGWSNKSGRKMLSKIINVFNPPAQKILNLNSIDFKDLVKENVSINMSELFGVNGNTSLYELTVINGITSNLNPFSILEIGTFDGRTTLNLAMNSGLNCKIYTLDLPASEIEKTSYHVEENEKQYIEKAASGLRFKDFEYADKINQIFGDSATYDFSTLPKANLIFIDGSHTYEYVLNDSLKCIEIIHANGIILWHDYGVWNGVTNALEYLKISDARFHSLMYIKDTSLAYLKV